MVGIWAIATAAGEGSRLGGVDKALIELGGSTAVERIAATCRAAGCQGPVVVRQRGAAALPAAVRGDTVEVAVAPGGAMRDSLLAGRDALPADAEGVLVWPVDHALVTADTVAGLGARLLAAGGATGIVLPLYRERPGHPVALRPAVLAELARSPDTTLRDVVRRDPARVAVLPTANPWVRRDLDTPGDLRAARAWLRGEPRPPTEWMHRHRSRRAFAPNPVPDDQVARLVDAARHAPTSAFVQAYSVVAVRDPGRRSEVARLCGDQAHVHGAPVFLAVCADMHKLALACSRHGTSLQDDGLEVFVQAVVDAALLGQNLQLAAESEGLGSCMIGAARNHPVALARLLGLPRHVFAVFGMVLGRPTDDPVPRTRMPLEGVLHHERYDDDAAHRAVDAADELMREWARAVNARGGRARPVDEQRGWSDRMARQWGEGGRYVVARATLREELRRLGFGLG